LANTNTDIINRTNTDTIATAAPKRLNANSKLYKTIIKAIDDKKGEQIISLDLRKIDEAVADYFIVCDVQSHVQMQAIANEIEKEVKEQCNERPYHIQFGEHWTLIDFVNIVIHIFDKEHRKFYDIEGLWADAVHKTIDNQ
jgi:ribosome-associated protein